MGVREEIEKLRKSIPKNLHTPMPNGTKAASLSYYLVYNGAIKDVLSILDEWELVWEFVDEIPAEEFAFYRTIPEGAGPDKMLKWIDELIVADPGDVIIIYVRRKKNESSS